MNYATEYTDKVLSGEIVAGRKIKQAARRYQRDLKASTKKFPYRFDEDQANAAIAFVEALPARDGSELHLELFQKWIVSELFGWRDKETGNRRYDRAYISMSRKNGKSFLMADLGAIYLFREAKPALNREVVYTANNNSQAHLAFDMMASGLTQVARKSGTLRRRLKVNRNEVWDTLTHSRAVPLASDLHSLDGYQSDLAIIDEYAAAKSNAVYDVLKSGQINSENSLLAVISTTGNNLNGPMFQEYQFVSKVLTRKEKADRYFIAIWEQDFKNEVFKPETWEKSNPLLANKQRAATMLPSLKSDVDLAKRQDNLLPVMVKNFNMWQQAHHNSYISAKDWRAATCQEKPNLKGRDVFLGIDLSKSSDLTSVSWIVPLDGYLYADSHSFVGTKYGLDTKIARDGIDYRKLEDNGEASITKLESGVIDYDEVLKFILDLIEQNDWNVRGICYDPYAFDYLLPEFSRRNMPLVEVRQGTRTLSIPTIRFRDAVFDKSLQHADNQLLAYAVNNAILKYDSNNNPIIDKVRGSDKIDPLAALMNAYTEAVKYQQNQEDQLINGVDASEFYSSDEFSF